MPVLFWTPLTIIVWTKFFFFSIYLLLFSTNNDRIFHFQLSLLHNLPHGCTLRRFTYAKLWSCWHLQKSNISLIKSYHTNCCKVQKYTIKFGIFIILLKIKNLFYYIIDWATCNFCCQRFWVSKASVIVVVESERPFAMVIRQRSRVKGKSNAITRKKSEVPVLWSPPDNSWK